MDPKEHRSPYQAASPAALRSGPSFQGNTRHRDSGRGLTVLEPPDDNELPEEDLEADEVMVLLEGGRHFDAGEYEALLERVDDGRKYEWIDGVIYVSPRPRLEHIQVVRNLVLLLVQVVHARGLGQIYFDPRVWLNDEARVVSDITWATPEQLASSDETKLIGAPVLAVEVLSPSTKHYDRWTKRAKYKASGVEEYWRVDPKTQRVELDFLDRRPQKVLEGGETVLTTELLPGWEVKLERLFDPVLVLGDEDLLALRKELTTVAEEAGRVREEAERRSEGERRQREAAEQAAESERRQREAAEQAAKRAEQAVESERRQREAAEQATESERRQREAAEQATESERRQREAAEQAAESERKRREAAEQAARRAEQRIEELEVLLRERGSPA